MGDKWYDEERYYQSERDSDDSPLLSNRYESRRHELYGPPRTEERPRPATFSVLARVVLFCSAMILFCMLMYIPVYYKASDQLSKGIVDGWSMEANRDTKIYVQPNNITTLHEPKQVCDKKAKNKLFLLIVVCSSTVNFKQRIAIRQTWGNYNNYLATSKIYQAVKQKYINYNFTYDLYPDVANVSRKRRDLSGYNRLLPALAEALRKKIDKSNTVTPENRFDDEMLPEFDMNEEMGEQTQATYDYYDTNIMKIAPNGYEDSPDVNKVLNMLRHNKKLTKQREEIKDGGTEPEFKLFFLLGLPTNDNDTRIQGKIEEEVTTYGDVIQEGFVDSYNNLTLKSIMMLKWITNNCGSGVHYILKTDDDMYVNVANLAASLRARARGARGGGREGLLVGDLICGARPVLDSHNKWFSPRYMYGGRVYPKYLSGTGYALSSDTASALYEAALRTNYFHLEDIFITGMCAARARPRITPRDDPLFSYQPARGVKLVCAAHAHVTAHRVRPGLMHQLSQQLKIEAVQDECERISLTKVRKERLKPKPPHKRPRLPKLVSLKPQPAYHR